MNTKARKGDLVYVEHERSSYGIKGGASKELGRFFALAESTTREGLVRIARDGLGMTYYGSGAGVKDQVCCWGAKSILVVPRDKLSASPADVMVALGTEPCLLVDGYDQVRIFPSQQAAVDALAPYRIFPTGEVGA